MRSSITLPSAIGLGLLLACNSHPPAKEVPTPAAAPDPRVAALDKALAGDPTLDHPAVREAVKAACFHPAGIWSAAGGTADAAPGAGEILRTLVRPWLRPVLMEAVDATFRERSRDLSMARGAFHYNVAILGSGPVGAVAALNLRQANPGLKVALIEEQARPGQTFRTFGRFTWINSPERGAASTNRFPGLPLAARDLLEPDTVQDTPYFLMPYHLADLTELTALTSGADCWLGVQAERLEPSPGQGLAIRMRGTGPRITADRVLVASGLGQVAPPADPAKRAPAVDTFEHITARATALVERNRLRRGAHASFMAPYAGKSIAIIGAGDSANNLAELAAGYAPPELYGKAISEAAQPGPRNGPAIGDPQGPASVVWVRQRAADAAAFVAGNKLRYHKTVTASYGAFTLAPERLRALHPLPSGQVELELEATGAGPGRRVTVDFVWRATGQEVASSPAIRALYQDVHGTQGSSGAVRNWIGTLDTVRGPITGNAPGPFQGKVVETTVGRRMPGTSALLETYFGGAVASPLATPQELQDLSITRNAASLETNLPRAASLAAHLAALPGYLPAAPPVVPPATPGPVLTPAAGHASWSALVRPRSRRPGILMAGLPSDPARRGAYTQIALASILGRTLHGQRFPVDFILRFQASDGALTVGAENLPADQANALIQDLGARTEFLALARDLARRSPKGVAVRVPGGFPADASRVQVQ